MNNMRAVLSVHVLSHILQGKFYSLSLEKGEPVLFRNFVTILRGASMQYIPKLATSQSQKAWSPFPQVIIQCTQLKFLLYTKYCTWPLGRKNSPVRSMWTFVYNSIYSYLFAITPFKVTYMDENIWNPLAYIWRLTNSWYAFHFPHHPSHHPWWWVMPKFLAWSLQHKREVRSLYISDFTYSFSEKWRPPCCNLWCSGWIQWWTPPLPHSQPRSQWWKHYLSPAEGWPSLEKVHHTQIWK